MPAAIPNALENGWLPEGVFSCTIEDIRQRFGCFQESDRRPGLFQQLREYHAELRKDGVAESLIVDGSFISKKAKPGDIDLVLILKRDHDLAADLSPRSYSLLSKKRVKKRYEFDLLVARSGSPEESEYLEYFQEIKYRPGQRKGILRIAL